MHLVKKDMIITPVGEPSFHEFSHSARVRLPALVKNKKHELILTVGTVTGSAIFLGNVQDVPWQIHSDRALQTLCQFTNNLPDISEKLLPFQRAKQYATMAIRNKIDQEGYLAQFSKLFNDTRLQSGVPLKKRNSLMDWRLYYRDTINGHNIFFLVYIQNREGNHTCFYIDKKIRGVPETVAHLKLLISRREEEIKQYQIKHPEEEQMVRGLLQRYGKQLAVVRETGKDKKINRFIATWQKGKLGFFEKKGQLKLERVWASCSIAQLHAILKVLIKKEPKKE
jgi:hypothetical protein